MASDAQIAANRRNAQQSTGPRTAEGKARSRLNALRHGLAVPPVNDLGIASKIESFAASIAEYPAQLEIARVAAEAHLEVLRVRQLKADMLNRVARQLPSTALASPSSFEERVCRAFAENARTLVACERYERRALSKRKRALAALPRPRKPRENVGPRVPRPRKTDLFDQEVVWKLEVNRFVKAATPYPWDRSLYSRKIDAWNTRYLLGLGAVMRFDDEASGVVQIELFYPGSERWYAEFVLAKIPSHVGNGTWTATCPKTGKRVKDLYVVATTPGVHSRHALELTYRSKNWDGVDRHGARMDWNMARIGADDCHVPPPRPKYMHRKTFNRCWWHVSNEHALAAAAGLGRAPPDLGGLDELLIDAHARSWGLVVESKPRTSRPRG